VSSHPSPPPPCSYVPDLGERPRHVADLLGFAALYPRSEARNQNLFICTKKVRTSILFSFSHTLQELCRGNARGAVATHEAYWEGRNILEEEGIRSFPRRPPPKKWTSTTVGDRGFSGVVRVNEAGRRNCASWPHHDIPSAALSSNEVFAPQCTNIVAALVPRNEPRLVPPLLSLPTPLVTPFPYSPTLPLSPISSHGLDTPCYGEPGEPRRSDPLRGLGFPFHGVGRPYHGVGWP